MFARASGRERLRSFCTRAKSLAWACTRPCIGYTPARREPHAGSRTPTTWTGHPGPREPHANQVAGPAACTQPGLHGVHPRARICILGLFGVDAEVIGLAEVRDPGQGPIEPSDKAGITRLPVGMAWGRSGPAREPERCRLPRSTSELRERMLFFTPPRGEVPAAPHAHDVFAAAYHVCPARTRRSQRAKF